MADSFQHSERTIESPAESAAAVTPHDTNEIAATRALYVGGAGDLTVKLVNDSSTVALVGVPAGSVLPIRVKLVTTASTATNIVALY